MSATSPLGAAGAVALALLTVRLLQRRFPAPPLRAGFPTLDGLRGFTAFFVYLQHGAALYVYTHTGAWQVPATRLFVHFGQSSVAIFFMITGLLFTSKLIDGRRTPIDWRRLYRSRVRRLAPLFVLFVALLWALAVALRGGRLSVSAPRALLQTAQWLSFTIAGMPDINFAPTSIIGGQAWSLAYEWWFYLALPAMALLLGQRPPRAWIAVSAAAVAGAVWWTTARGGWPFAASFLGGIAAAFLVRQARLRRGARHPAAGLVCLAALAATSRFPTAFAPAPLLLLSFAFVIVAAGNSVFGVLEWACARGLGEMGYSIYLLHSILLFTVFAAGLGPARSAVLDGAGHWLVILACVPPLIVASFVTFRTIEAPAMRSIDRVNALAAP